jgi:hypothetical protein
MKYIFKQIDNISGHSAETTIEFNADYLPDILQHFEMFLRGSGFHPTGTLDFVHDEDYHDEPLEWHKEEPSSIYDGDLNSPSAGAFSTKGQNAN